MADPVENLAAAAEQVERGADEQAGSKRKRGTALEVAMKKVKDLHERIELSRHGAVHLRRQLFRQG